MSEFTAMVLGFVLGFLAREYFDKLVNKLKKKV